MDIFDAINLRNMAVMMSAAAVLVFALNWYAWPQKPARQAMLWGAVGVVTILTVEGVKLWIGG